MISVGEAWIRARNLARTWIATNAAPSAIERPATRVLTSALIEGHNVDRSLVETIMREQLKKWVGSEMDSTERK